MGQKAKSSWFDVGKNLAFRYGFGGRKRLASDIISKITPYYSSIVGIPAASPLTPTLLDRTNELEERTKKLDKGANTRTKVLGKYLDNVYKANVINKDVSDLELKERVYKTVDPIGYVDFNKIRQVSNVINGNHKTELTDEDVRRRGQIRQAFWNKYLGFTDTNAFIEESPYKPANAKDPNAKYYRIAKPFDGPFYNLHGPVVQDDYILEGHEGKWLIPRENVYSGEGVLGAFTVDKGKDENGEYLSAYDIYDLNPFEKFGINIEPGVRYGIGKPFEYYDRVYLKKKGGKFIPQIIIDIRNDNKKSRTSE